jgi:hypothetical protein
MFILINCVEIDCIKEKPKRMGREGSAPSYLDCENILRCIDGGEQEIIKCAKEALVLITIAVWSAFGIVLAAAFSAADATNDEIWHTNQGNRPAINPDFDPDFDCIFDVFQIHCIPGSEQECPKPEFSAGDPHMCFPNTLVDGKWEWECPEKLVIVILPV